MSNWSRLLIWIGPGTEPQSSKLFKRFLKIIALVYIYQLTKFGSLMICGSKYIFEKCTVSHVLIFIWCHGFGKLGDVMVKNAETISWEWNITFLQNKKNGNLCLRWHILRSYHFVEEVTFNGFYVLSKKPLALKPHPCS